MVEQVQELMQLRVELSVAEALIPRTQRDVDAVEVMSHGSTEPIKTYLVPRKLHPGPKSPAKDEVLVLLDTRGGRDSGSIAGVLNHWSEVASNAVLGADPVKTLLSNWHALHKLDQVALFAEDLRRLISRCRRAVGVSGMGSHAPVGRCPTQIGVYVCGGPLWFHKAESVVSCGRCRTDWNGDALLNAVEDLYLPAVAYTEDETPRRNNWLTTLEIAERYAAKAGTVRQWIKRSGLKRDAQGHVDVEQLDQWLSTHGTANAL